LAIFFSYCFFVCWFLFCFFATIYFVARHPFTCTCITDHRKPSVSHTQCGCDVKTGACMWKLHYIFSQMRQKVLSLRIHKIRNTQFEHHRNTQFEHHRNTQFEHHRKICLLLIATHDFVSRSHIKQLFMYISLTDILLNGFQNSPFIKKITLTHISLLHNTHNPNAIKNWFY
jgi:hypothetical protein